MIKMNRVEALAGAHPGQAVYAIGCQACHGNDLKGGGHFGSPALLGLAGRLTAPEIRQTIYQGKGAMPALEWLDERQVSDVSDYLLSLSTETEVAAESTSRETAVAEEPAKPAWPYPYIMDGYQWLRTEEGYPISAPPWGTLTAMDLDGATIRWQIPLGEYPALAERGIRNTGSANYGGPVATAGGLIFIAATPDEKIRAFRSRDGQLLWEAPLPAAGYATPAVYEAGGRQFVVVACGGGKLGTDSGDRYVAFALPAD
jgi:quinoprotein glucose dehydrogenase